MAGKILIILFIAFGIANICHGEEANKTRIIVETSIREQIVSTQNPIVETAMNKAKLNEEIREKAEGLREGCFPRPGAEGCRCVVKDAEGHDMENIYNTESNCKIHSTPEPIAETAMNKAKMNEELREKVEGLREGCFPRPKGVGCRCVEKDAEGHDGEKIFETDAECKVPSRFRFRREARVQQPVANNEVNPQQNNRNQQKTQQVGGVDPVAERARQNYAAVLDELKNKFAGLKEGCYPRPKGCLCVVGTDATGREITERRLKDSDCKCAAGERSRDCPTGGA